MFHKLSSYIQLVRAYVRLNFNSHIEYRGAFIAQALAMFINNCFWLTFWSLFFARFPALNGWHLSDVVAMWCICSAAYGLAHMLCGNSAFLAVIIAKGQLDAWMLYPRALLSHLILGKMGATACGDMLFGILAYVLLNHPDTKHMLLFLVLVLIVAVLYTAFDIIAGSLSFFFGNSERLSEELRYALITFGTYPETLFKGEVRTALYLIIPAGFTTYLPVAALRDFSLLNALYTAVGTLAFLVAAIVIFYHGLSRYESGNLMEMRG